MELESTIAAISTPPGGGGIGIVRLSGPDAIKIASAIFRPAEKNTSLLSSLSHTVCYGHIVSNGKTIDETLVNVMKAPKTYTREDIVEINCHGGIIPLQQTLSLALTKGARMADPGEFTRRAFLNGRIDLSQAEAVADIINARTEAAGQIAISHLQGELKDKIEELASSAGSILAEVEASIEFSDEGIQPKHRTELNLSVEKLLYETQKLLSTGEFGRILREGLNIAIVGVPNVGKSSLFNALTGQDRTIVTPIAGTTRDVVETSINIEGIPVILADTAGINKNSNDIIEKESIERSCLWTEKADFIILVLDGTDKVSTEDLRMLQKLSRKPMVVAINKSDLRQKIDKSEIIKLTEGKPVLQISAATGRGLNNLRKTIVDFTNENPFKNKESVIISNRRHIDALKKSESALKEAKIAINSFGEEILAHNLKESLAALEEISGKSIENEILSKIFSNFCIGK